MVVDTNSVNILSKNGSFLHTKVHYIEYKITNTTAYVVSYILSGMFSTGTNSATGISDRVGTTNGVTVPNKHLFRCYLVYIHITLVFHHPVYITNVLETVKVCLVFNKNWLSLFISVHQLIITFKMSKHKVCSTWVATGVLTFHPTRQIVLPGLTAHAHTNI